MRSKANLDIHAKDKTARAFNSVKGNLDRMDKGVRRFTGGLAGLAGGAAVAGFAGLAKKSLDAADAIEKLGRRTGATAPFLSEMRFALSQNDVTMEQFENTLRKVNKSAQDAADGLSTPARAFDKLGIDVQKFNALNTDQKFIALSEAISKIEDPAIRTQTAMDIMGRSGDRLLTVMEDGASGLDNYRGAAKEMGLSLSQDTVDGAAEANDALDKLSKSISGSFQQVILRYSGSIKSAADFTGKYLPKAFEFLMDIIRSAKVVFQSFIGTIFLGFNKFFGLLAKIPKVGKMFEGLRDSTKLAFDVMDDQLKSTVGNMGQWYKSADKVGTSAKNVKKPIDDASGAIAALGRSSETATDKNKKLNKSLKEIKSTGERVGFDLSDLTVTIGRVRGETASNTLAARELAKAYDSGVIKSIEELRAVASKLGIDLGELEEKNNKTTETFRAKWERTKDAIQSSLSGLFEGVFNGEIKSIKDFAKQAFDVIKKMLAQMVAEVAASKLFDLLGGLFGKKSGGGSLLDLGGLLGGGSGGSGDAVKTALDLGGLVKSGSKIFSGGMASISAGAAKAWGAVKAGATALKSGAMNLIGAIPGWGQAILAVGALYAMFGGGRSKSEVMRDELDSLRGGQFVGRGIGGGAVQIGATDGEHGAGGFFTGRNLKTLASMADARGLDARLQDGALRIIGGESMEQINQLLADFEARLGDVAVATGDWFSMIKSGAIDSANELVQNLIVGGFGKTQAEAKKTMVAIDKEFDKFRASGESASEAVYASIARVMGMSINESKAFVESSGVDVATWAKNFESASGKQIIEMLKVGETGRTVFEGLAQNAQESGENMATTIKQSLFGLQGTLNDVDLGTPKAVNVDVNQTVNNQQSSEIKALIKRMDILIAQGQA